MRGIYVSTLQTADFRPIPALRRRFLAPWGVTVRADPPRRPEHPASATLVRNHGEGCWSGSERLVEVPTECSFEGLRPLQAAAGVEVASER